VAAIAIESNRSNEAVASLERLIALHPNNPHYFSNLGEAERRLGNFEVAASALVRAITLKPDLVQAHFNLGLVMHELGEVTASVQAFERAAELKPDSAQIQRRLARALADSGERAQAVGHYQCAWLQSPKDPDLLVDYATCLRKLKRFDTALRTLAHALDFAPNHALAHHERSATLVELGRFDEAIHCSRQAIALDPKLAQAHAGLASALVSMGGLDQGIAEYRRALELEPNNELIHGNLVFLLGFQVGSSAQAILDEAHRWSERHAVPLSLRPHANTPEPTRRLRIGYVSSNFNAHCQALFTLPLFEQHDRHNFELYAYSDLAQLDEVSAQLRQHFTHWSDISRLDAAEVADLVRSHEIDLLIDLTMHMSVSKLGIFARKPAPVQIAWLAYPGTTGLSTMDYRVTDRYLDPPDRPAEPYSEASLVLPDSFWCYHPGSDTPQVNPLPALSNGFVTFGCLNSFWKLNDLTLLRWASVLERVLGSRLLLLAPEGSARTHVLEVLQRAGIDGQRIEFVSRRPRAEYLKYYHRIDLCLDALPYNGHTTSLDAFWMGVPVVTLVGDTVVGRAGLCQAMNLGLPELVTHTPQEFALTAARLANELNSLADLRAGLRERMQRSPLMAAERFARNLEAQYRAAWQRWCESAAAEALESTHGAEGGEL